MKIKCDYCGSEVEDNQENCPNCGAILSGVERFANGQPTTIEQLHDWYQAMKLPPEDVTRFYIGKDIKSAKAFGIYQDANGDFIVYKNKADGTRAVRYQGRDEAYAVNELYLRLKEEIANQKNRNADQRMAAAAGRSRRRSSSVGAIVAFIIIAIFGSITLLAIRQKRQENAVVPRPERGYYTYDGYDYYYSGTDWYYYINEYDDWGHTVAEKIPQEVVTDIDGVYHVEGHEGQAFEDTFWYHEPETSDRDSYDSYDSYDNNWDDDWDSNWDSDDSWDSDYSDWDSDW